MIVQVRGTSGSGKTHLIRMLMEEYSDKKPIRSDQLPTGKKRKHPIGYRLSAPGTSNLFVPGHYETACGGVDTINWARTKEGTPEPGVTGWEFANRLVRGYAIQGCHVIYEGLMVGYDKRFVEGLKADNYDVAIIGLTTPFEECKANIIKRREARGDFSKFYPHNTRQRIPVMERGMNVLENRGIRVERLSVDEAYRQCLEWFGIKG